MQRRTLAAALALALALAACGGDDDSNEGGATETTETTAGGSAGDGRTEEQLAADLAVAEEAALRLEDLPAGFEIVTEGADVPDEGTIEQLALCVGVDLALLDDEDNPEAESPQFTSAEGVDLSSTVAVAASIEEATTLMDVVQDEAAPGCLAEQFRSLLENPPEGTELPADLQIGEITAEVAPLAEAGDERVAYQLMVPISTAAGSVDLYLGFVAVRDGRALIDLTTTQAGAPFSSDEASRLAQVIVDRLPADL